MKHHNGFIANSSSCTFLIYNRTSKPKMLNDFVEENREAVDNAIQQIRDDFQDQNLQIDVSSGVKLGPHTVASFEVSNENEGIWLLFYYLGDCISDSFICGPERIQLHESPNESSFQF